MHSLAVLIRRLPAIACALVGLFLVSCSPSAVTVSGQVFVVTNGRENIKLALVEIIAVAEKDWEARFRKWNDENVAKRKELLWDYQQALQLIGTQREIIARNEDVPISRRNHLSFATAQEGVLAFEKLDSIFNPLSQLSQPGTTAVVTKSDADGKFTLAVPPGKYLIVASASRKVAGNAENYSWGVWVDASSPVQSFMLSNDNLVETKCKNCILLPQI